MALDVMTAVNFVLAFIILAMGLLNFTKKKDAISLYIGVGFGLFALSHLLTLAGMATSLEIPLVVVRVVGYMSVILGLYIAMKAKPEAPAKKRK